MSPDPDHSPDQGDDEPITKWLNQLPEGDSFAQREIWERFARSDRSGSEETARRSPATRFGRRRRGREGAQQSLPAIVQRSAQPPPSDRAELWNLLLGMTRNKSAEEARRKLAQKRGGGKVRGESAFGANADETGNRGIDRVTSNAPDPQRAFDEAQQLTKMLNELDDPQLRRIALLKMANHTEQEIAHILGCGKRTVSRKLEQIRDQFSE